MRNPEPGPAGEFTIAHEPEVRVVYAPQQAEVTRVCAICGTRQAVRAMGLFGTSMACLDEAGCAERAAASDLYPQIEDEEALTSFQAAQGAVRGPSAYDHELALLRQTREADRLADAANATEVGPA